MHEFPPGSSATFAVHPLDPSLAWPVLAIRSKDGEAFVVLPVPLVMGAADPAGRLREAIATFDHPSALGRFPGVVRAHPGLVAWWELATGTLRCTGIMSDDEAEAATAAGDESLSSRLVALCALAGAAWGGEWAFITGRLLVGITAPDAEA